MNRDIVALKLIINSSESGDYITGFKELVDGSGYTISFFKSGTIVIKNGEKGDDGKKGEDGQDGQNGQNGTDGKDEDGTDGEKEQDGIDGQDGQDGTDGKDGQDGTDGKDGQDGTDGEDWPGWNRRYGRSGRRQRTEWDNSCRHYENGYGRTSVLGYQECRWNIFFSFGQQRAKGQSFGNRWYCSGHWGQCGRILDA